MPTPNLKTFLINSLDEFPKGKYYFVVCNKDIILASRSSSKSTCDRIEYQMIGSDESWYENDKWDTIAEEALGVSWPLLCIDPGEILLDTNGYLSKDQDAWMSD
jgi:hypothetical protein